MTGLDIHAADIAMGIIVIALLWIGAIDRSSRTIDRLSPEQLKDAHRLAGWGR